MDDTYQRHKAAYLADHARLRTLYWTRFLGRKPTESDYKDRHQGYVRFISDRVIDFHRTKNALRKWRTKDHPFLYGMLNTSTTNAGVDAFLRERAYKILLVQTAFGLDTADRNSADKAFLLAVDPVESSLLLDILPLSECPYAQP